MVIKQYPRDRPPPINNVFRTPVRLASPGWQSNVFDPFIIDPASTGIGGGLKTRLPGIPVGIGAPPVLKPSNSIPAVLPKAGGSMATNPAPAVDRRDIAPLPQGKYYRDEIEKAAKDVEAIRSGSRKYKDFDPNTRYGKLVRDIYHGRMQNVTLVSGRNPATLPPPQQKAIVQKEAPIMDLGQLITDLGTTYIQSRYAQPPVTQPAFLPQVDVPFVDVIPQQPTADCGGSLVYKKVCGEYRWVKQKRRRRKRLASKGDLKDLAALKGILGQGKALDTWIATHS